MRSARRFAPSESGYRFRKQSLGATESAPAPYSACCHQMTLTNLRHDIRNVAIIAHVDHGKTTLVDALLKQSHTFRDNQDVGTLIIVVINKVDRKNADPKAALSKVHDLFLELAEDADQLEAPVIYAVAKEGRAGTDADDLAPDLEPLFKTIIEHIPAPVIEPGAFQMLVANRAYDDYTGPMAIGRISRGSIAPGDAV